jgi:hypothetical protein
MAMVMEVVGRIRFQVEADVLGDLRVSLPIVKESDIGGSTARISLSRLKIPIEGIVVEGVGERFVLHKLAVTKMVIEGILLPVVSADGITVELFKVEKV